MNDVVIGAGEVKPAPCPRIVHDDQYNVDAYLAQESDKYVLDLFVPAHAKLDLTIKCVKSIYNFTQTPFHLIILDDAPVDDYGLTERWVKEQQKLLSNITYIHSNINWKTGNTFFNCGLKFCRTEYVATIMNSVTVEPFWEMTALQLLQNDKQIGTVGFKCLFPSGYIESAGIAFVGCIPTDMLRDEPGYRGNEVREAQAVQWAFALHRKAALVGNLEEDVFNGHVGWDDIDNNMCLKAKGWKIIYCGQGIGIHAPRSTRGSNSEDAFMRNQENSHRFFKRWGLWANYLEGNKMNVADILKADTKDQLTHVITEIQVLRALLANAEKNLTPTVNKALKELGMSEGKYIMEMNPALNQWTVKVNPNAVLEQPTIPVEDVKPAGDTENKAEVLNTTEGVKA